MKHAISRREFLKVAAGVVGTGFLAACVAPAPPAAAPEPTKAPEATQAPGPVAAPKVGLEGKEGVLWGLQYDPHVEAYKRLAKLFKDKTGASLTIEPQAWPLEPKLTAALSAGTQPDILCMGGSQLIPLHLQKVFIPLNDVILKPMNVDLEKDFIGDGLAAYTWQSVLYGIPVEDGVTGTVNVPVDDVKKLGLADKYPPTNGQVWFESYEHMWELAKALQIEEDGRVVRWGLSSKGWDTLRYCSILRSLLASEGTDWWDQKKERFNIDTEAGSEAMKLHVETPVKLGIETELDQSHMDAALAGKVALAFGNGSIPGEAAKVGLVYEAAGPPKVRPGELPLNAGFAGWGFVSPTTAREQDIAIEFLRMMVTTEAQREWCKIYGGFLTPAWRALVGKFDHFADPNPDSVVVKAAKLFQENIAPRTQYMGEGFGYAGEIEPAGQEVCSMVRQGKLTAAEGAKEFAARCEASRNRLLEDIKKYSAS